MMGNLFFGHEKSEIKECPIRNDSKIYNDEDDINNPPKRAASDVYQSPDVGTVVA